MRRSSFRQFEVFEAIARRGSFTRAAEELFLTQPTVSMQIKKLSDTVGLSLFEQIGKRIYLTDAGEALLITCREIFESLNNFEMQILDMKGLKRGKLRFAVVTTAKYFAPRLLGSFCRQYPGIDVSLEVCNREGLLERISENLDDLYVLGQPPNGLNVVYEAFLDNHLVVVAANNHPLAKQRNISLKRLAQEPFIMREAGSGTRMAVERLFDQHKLKFNTRMELGSTEAIKQTVLGGLGIAVLSMNTLGQNASMGQLRVLDVKHFPIKGKWYVAYPSGKKPSIVARTFLEYLHGAADQLALDSDSAVVSDLMVPDPG
ncbi:MAG: LysR family transcriptional regulator [Ectothiorhodospiraceae bacterium]|nr:LysR family transcriptional regulator [Ectothiorhodospiraceae bacterium]